MIQLTFSKDRASADWPLGFADPLDVLGPPRIRIHRRCVSREADPELREWEDFGLCCSAPSVVTLEGRLDGYALRVPVPTGSATDLTPIVREPATTEAANAAFAAAADGVLKGYVTYTEAPIV